MNHALEFVTKHGYSFLFAAVFAREIGLPVPAFPFLLAAGALAATGSLALFPSIVLAAGACVLADWVWYEAGRRDGEKVLHFMHRFTRDPEFHDRRAKRIFAKYGPPLLLVSTFLPGLDAVAPPLVGASRVSRIRFLAFETAGACIWASTYAGLGYIFSHDLNRAAAYASQAGRLVVALAFVGICIFLAQKLIRWQRLAREPRRVQIAPTTPFESGDSIDMACEIVGGQENGK